MSGYPGVSKFRDRVVTVTSSSSNVFGVAPYRGRVTRIDMTNLGTISGAFTATCNINGAAITGGSISVTTSTAGAVYTALPTALNNVNQGDILEFGQGTAAQACVNWYIKEY